MIPDSKGNPCKKQVVSGGTMCARHTREHVAKIRKVMIGTLSYDGRLDVFYTNSLIETIRKCPENISIAPIFLSYDSLIQRARNDTLAMALQNGFDDLIFIDSDISWDPEWLFRLLQYPVDVVGGTYRKKSDESEMYVTRILKNPAEIDTRTGLMKVDGLGCGFIRLSRKAMQYLWDASEPYQDRGEKRMVFEVVIESDEIISEDIWMCTKLKRGGFDIHLDPRICCDHVGIKKFQGNFANWYDNLNFKKDG
jgi:glycosyltransferase involved in cell wall biosynthesis